MRRYFDASVATSTPTTRLGMDGGCGTWNDKVKNLTSVDHPVERERPFAF